MDYVLIKNGKVENVIVADEDFIAKISGDYDHIEPMDTVLEKSLGVGVGWTYADGVFTAPPPVQQVVQQEPKHISVGAFFDRFGQHKWSILADNSPAVQALIKDCSVRKWIDLDDPQLDAGLQMLVTAGHDIVPSEILSAEVQEQEKP